MGTGDKIRGITLRKDGRYQWRFKQDGIQYFGYAKTAEEAEAAMIDAKYKVNHGLYFKEDTITVSDYFKTWMDVYKCGRKISTRETYEIVFDRHIRPHLGRKKMKDVRSANIQAVYNKLALSMSHSSILKVNCVMSGMFKQAYRDGLIASNPVDRTSIPKGKVYPKKRAARKDIVDLFLKEMKDNWYWPVYRLATLTGMRLGELLALTWDDVDLDKKVIHVRHTMDYLHGYVIVEPKTENGRRDIPLRGEAPKLLRDLKKEWEMRQRDGSKKRLGKQNDLPFVITDESGGVGKARAIQQYIFDERERLISRGVNIPPDFSFHSLRHCFATRCLESGMSYKALQKVMGHASLSTTMDIYADCLDDMLSGEMDKVSDNL